MKPSKALTFPFVANRLSVDVNQDVSVELAVNLDPFQGRGGLGEIIGRKHGYDPHLTATSCAVRWSPHCPVPKNPSLCVSPRIEEIAGSREPDPVLLFIVTSVFEENLDGSFFRSL